MVEQCSKYVCIIIGTLLIVTISGLSLAYYADQTNQDIYGKMVCFGIVVAFLLVLILMGEYVRCSGIDVKLEGGGSERDTP
jgi:hypothetical protein